MSTPIIKVLAKRPESIEHLGWPHKIAVERENTPFHTQFLVDNPARHAWISQIADPRKAARFFRNIPALKQDG
jgi:hypothetical protein